MCVAWKKKSIRQCSSSKREDRDDRKSTENAFHIPTQDRPIQMPQTTNFILEAQVQFIIILICISHHAKFFFFLIEYLAQIGHRLWRPARRTRSELWTEVFAGRLHGVSISIWHFDDSPLPASNLVRCCCLLRHSSAHGWMGEIEVCNGDALSNRIYEQQVGSLRIAFEVGLWPRVWPLRLPADGGWRGVPNKQNVDEVLPLLVGVAHSSRLARYIPTNWVAVLSLDFAIFCAESGTAEDSEMTQRC